LYERSPDYIRAMKLLLCPHCQTPTSDKASVCRGCGAEIVRGASRRERALIGAMFVIAAMLIGVVVLRVLQTAHGALPLPPPKAEDGFLVLVGVFAVVVVPYVVGTRIARMLWRSRIRFHKTYENQ
jgi:hypothetical protein